MKKGPEMQLKTDDELRSILEPAAAEGELTPEAEAAVAEILRRAGVSDPRRRRPWLFYALCLALGVLISALFLGCATPRPRIQAQATTPPALSVSVPVMSATSFTLEGPISDETSAAITAWLSVYDLPGNALTINIDSPGGSLEAGMTIVKRLESARATITCKVDGLAASAAFAILQTCPTRVMRTRSILMTHGPSVQGLVRLDEVSAQELADQLRVFGEAFGSVCRARLNVTPEEYRRRTTGRAWWMSSSDAIGFGAVDRVEP